VSVLSGGADAIAKSWSSLIATIIPSEENFLSRYCKNVEADSPSSDDSGNRTNAWRERVSALLKFITRSCLCRK
jgi:hypothetical protein